MSVGALTTSVFSGEERIAEKPFAQSVAHIAGAQYVTAGIGFLTSVVVARLLGPTDFGLAVLITSYPALLSSLLAVKSGSITTRYISSFRATQKKSELLSTCKFGYAIDLLVALATLVLVALSGWWVAGHFYHIAGSSWLMLGYAVSFPFWSLVGTSVAIVTSFQRFGCVAGLQILSKAIECLVVISLLLMGFGVPGFVLGVAVSNILFGFIALTVATRTLRLENLGSCWGASLSVVTPLRKELTGFFSWNYFAVTCSGLLENLPLMLLGYVRGPADAGFYRLARSVVAPCSYLEVAMGKVAYPLLSSRSATTRLHGLSAYLKRWTLVGGLPAGALVLVGIPILPLLIPVVFGGHYSPMVTGVQIMMVASAVSAIFFWLSSFYYASGKIACWTMGCILQTVPVTGLAWFVIYQWGFVGMATLATIGKVVFTLSMAVASKRVTGTRFANNTASPLAGFKLTAKCSHE